MRNQWRFDFSERRGLDMSVFEMFCRRLGVPEEETDEVFHCVLVMEQAALRFFESKRSNK